MNQILFFIFLIMELAFTGYCIVKKPRILHYRRLHFISIGCELVLLLGLSLPTGGLDTTGKLLLAFLLIRTGIAGIFWAVSAHCPLRQPQRRKKSLALVFRAVGCILLFGCAMVPSVLFPGYDYPAPSGSHEVACYDTIWTDEDRLEAFEEDGSCREVPVHFFYPGDWDGETEYPLVIFSHGAFGYYQSNHSTYMELASSGYVVCSLDHPYHSFFTRDTSGKLITVNPAFMQGVMRINGDTAPEDEVFKLSGEWNDLRVDDMEFVLDTIEMQKNSEDELFQMINYDKVGLIGHSLGGSAAVSLGRKEPELIDAVIDLDGTMLGEQVSYTDGAYTYEEAPYPVPLLLMQNEEHALEAKDYGLLYVNNAVLQNAVDARSVTMKGAGHMNFTDLPLVAPVLADFLGTGTVDAKECIRNMNEVVLQFFDYYLKDSGTLSIRESY